MFASTTPPAPDASDAAADLRAATAGDAEAFGRIYTAHVGRIHALALRLTPWARLAAAAAVLVVGSVGVTWTVMRSSAPVAPVVEVPPPESPALARFASYERMATELSATLEQKRAMLDPATRAVLERSLRTIDDALLEARAALEGDPSSAAIRTYVEAAYRHKLDFLRRANDVADLRGS